MQNNIEARVQTLIAQGYKVQTLEVTGGFCGEACEVSVSVLPLKDFWEANADCILNCIEGESERFARMLDGGNYKADGGIGCTYSNVLILG